MAKKSRISSLEKISHILDKIEYKIDRLTLRHCMDCTCHLCTANNLLSMSSRHILSEIEYIFNLPENLPEPESN